MKREEAIAKGQKVQEIQHSMKRRSPWHNYHRKGTYLLTLVVDGRQSLLGVLKGETTVQNDDTAHAATVSIHYLPDSQNTARVEYSALGQAIIEEEIPKIHRYYPMVEVWKVCIMPDHIHLIVRVNEDMPADKHLGQVVRGFKTGCSRAWWRLSPAPIHIPSGKAEGTVATVPTASPVTPSTTIPTASPLGPSATVPTASPLGPSTTVPTASPLGPSTTVPTASPLGQQRKVLFEPGYNDKILLHDGQLANWKAYLDDNPRRLLVKRQKPQFFTVLHGMEVAGHKCQIVGNCFLLDIPDKVAVIVHRRYTDEENTRLRQEWLACGERGGVLVSAAISPKEKSVMREAMERGYRIILLRENGFPQLYKPSGESFDACSSGQLLQISPWEHHMQKATITRAQCLELNAMVELIASH